MGALGEIRQITVRYMPKAALLLFFGKGNKILANTVANAATARMQHHPDILIFIDTQLNKMITTAQRTELFCPSSLKVAQHFEQPLVLIGDAL